MLSHFWKIIVLAKIAQKEVTHAYKLSWYACGCDVTLRKNKP
jgi:hypothetical protein